MGIPCVGAVIKARVKDACMRERMQRRGGCGWRVASEWERKVPASAYLVTGSERE